MGPTTGSPVSKELTTENVLKNLLLAMVQVKNRYIL
jgi:hypothetical protein